MSTPVFDLVSALLFFVKPWSIYASEARPRNRLWLFQFMHGATVEPDYYDCFPMEPCVTADSRKRKSEEAFLRKPNNKAVIEETLRCCNSMQGLEPANVTQVYTLPANEYPRDPDLAASAPEIEVVNADCVEVATGLSKISDSRVWLLNMASSTKPGGGVFAGSNAQEEHLCRCSNLLPQLQRAKAEHIYPLHSYEDSSRTPAFTVLVHSNVVFFRNSADYKMLPRREWSEIGVLTAAAERMPLGYTALGYNAPRFIAYLLCVAQMQECSHLVLSAWGCGAYHQSAAEVAQCFNYALRRVDQRELPKVIFAVMDDHNSIPPGNVASFMRVFKQ